MYPRVGEKRRIDDINLEDEEAIGSLCRLSGRPVSPSSAMEHEKRIRREIANSNERRRMQSINAGFASLKNLLPHHEGEKLSKAAILQQTTEYIYQLEQEKTRLLSQNCELKRLLNQQHHSDQEGSPTGGDSPSEDRTMNTASPTPTTLTVTSSGLGTTLPTPVSLSACVTNPKSDEQHMETRVIHALDKDRRHPRIQLEEHIKAFEAELFPDRVQDVGPQQMKLKYNGIEIRPDMEEGCESAVSTTVVTEAKIDQAEYAAIQEIHLSKSMKTSYVDSTVPPGVTSRISIPVGVTPSNIECHHSDATFRSVHARTTPSTILTVVPANKSGNKNLSPVLELRGISEVADTEGTAPTATVEYVDENHVGALRNHTVYILNSSSSSSQKSLTLNSICEAIRHVEGPHRFPLEEQAVKEEVVTDETFTIDEDQLNQRTAVPHADTQQTTHHSTVVSADHYSESSNASHSLGGTVDHLTLHMLPPEPQEVPLELTTTHRSSGGESHQYIKHENEVCSSQQQIVTNPTFYHHSSRQGVIVVKHE